MVWIGKKESQFTNRQVFFIGLDRIVPARFYSEKIYFLAKKATLQEISENKVKDIENHLSYILEETFKGRKSAEHLDKNVFQIR